MVAEKRQSAQSKADGASEMPEIEVSAPLRSPKNSDHPQRGGEAYEVTLEKAKTPKRNLTLGSRTPRAGSRERGSLNRGKCLTTPGGVRSKSAMVGKRSLNGTSPALANPTSTARASPKKPEDADELKVTASVKKAMTCVGCLKICGGPLFKCRSGHLLCVRCQPNHKRCPTQETACAYDLWYPRAAVEEERRLLRHLQMVVHCTHGDCDYQDRVWKYKHHADVCPYHPLRCPIKLCAEEVAQKDLKAHIRARHARVTAELGNFALDTPFRATFHMTKATAQAARHDWITPIFTVAGQTFLLRLTKSGHWYRVWVQQASPKACHFEVYVSCQGLRLDVGHLSPVHPVTKSDEAMARDPDTLQLSPDVVDQLWLLHGSESPAGIDRSLTFNLTLRQLSPCLCPHFSRTSTPVPEP